MGCRPARYLRYEFEARIRAHAPAPASPSPASAPAPTDAEASADAAPGRGGQREVPGRGARLIVVDALSAAHTETPGKLKSRLSSHSARAAQGVPGWLRMTFRYSSCGTSEHGPRGPVPVQGHAALAVPQVPADQMLVGPARCRGLGELGERLIQGLAVQVGPDPVGHDLSQHQVVVACQRGEVSRVRDALQPSKASLARCRPVQ